MEISLGTADLSESEILDLLKNKTDADFTIDRLEIDESTGNMQIIIKFEDSEEANKFVRTVESKRGRKETYFRNFTAIQKANSYSHSLSPVFWCAIFSFSFNTFNL